MELPAQSKSNVHFAEFELDLTTGELRSNGGRIYLQEKPFQVLTLLLERPGELVTRDQLVKQLWPEGTFVDFDQSLNKAVNRLREALGDSAEEPKFIETVPRRGYRFIAQIENQRAAETIAETTAPRSQRMKWAAISCALGLVVTVGAIRWTRTHGSRLSQIRLSLLTVNSADNPVGGAAISPDGKYFAYTDPKGMHLKLLATNEIRDLPLPDALKDRPVDWQIGGWFPDSARFVVNASPVGPLPDEVSSKGTSIWIFSVLGSPPRRIRDDAQAEGVSPDGSAIAFGANPGRFGDREIWLMGPDGNNARKLYDTDENSSINSVLWSPNGKFIAYTRVDSEGGVTFITRDLNGGPPTTIFPPSVGNDIVEYIWVPGRWIYSSAEPYCSFFEQAIDVETGKAIGQPRRLTSPSVLSCMTGESATADGKKLAFLKWQSEFTVYVGDLDSSGTHLVRSKHFSLTRSHDDPGAWTPDGKALVLISTRTSVHGLYKQLLGEDDAQYLPDTRDARNPEVTPDGKWVLYFMHPEHVGAPSLASKLEPLMRAAIEGGSPQPVLTATGMRNLISCARPPSDLCVIAEWSEDRRQAIVHAIDPIKGRGAELTRFDVDPGDDRWMIALSPDGNRLAGIRRPQDPIYIWPLKGTKFHEIRVNGWTNLRSVRWSADSNSVLVLSNQKGYGTLLHTDLLGHANVLWEHVTENWSESPDGHHLAVSVHTMDQNYWMMEYF